MSPGGFSNPIVNPQGKLVVPQVMSPNFNIANPGASPSPSWAILKSGLAYFVGLVLSGGTITGTDYIINTTGAFFYSGVPALGNLAVSIVPGAVNVLDPLGNTAFPGVTSYNGGQSIEMVSALLRISNASFSPGLVYAPFPGQLDVQSPVISGTDTAAMLALTSAQYGSGTVPTATLNAALTTTAGTAAVATLITTDTPHIPAYGNNWGPAATGTDLTYQLMPDGTVQVSGRLVNSTAGGLSGGVNITGAALPAAYIPARDEPLCGQAHLSAAPFGATTGSFILVRSTGFIEFFGTFATTDTLEVSGRYPLGF